MLGTFLSGRRQGDAIIGCMKEQNAHGELKQALKEKKSL